MKYNAWSDATELCHKPVEKAIGFQDQKRADDVEYAVTSADSAEWGHSGICIAMVAITQASELIANTGWG